MPTNRWIIFPIDSAKPCGNFLATTTETAGCDEKLIAAAFGNFARAKGMMKVARDFGFAR